MDITPGEFMPGYSHQSYYFPQTLQDNSLTVLLALHRAESEL